MESPTVESLTVPPASDHSWTHGDRRRDAGRSRSGGGAQRSTPHRRLASPLIVGAALAVQVACGGGDGAGGGAGRDDAAAPPRALEQSRAPVGGGDSVATGDSAATGDSVAAGAAGAAAAAAADACPMFGLWRDCSVRERLERSGFVIVPVADSVGQPGLGIPGSAYRLGSAELQLYVYADSSDARRQEASLDAAAARPADASGVLRAPAVIRSNNLLALLFNNNDRQLERVQLALTAGLPVR